MVWLILKIRARTGHQCWLRLACGDNGYTEVAHSTEMAWDILAVAERCCQGREGFYISHHSLRFLFIEVLHSMPVRCQEVCKHPGRDNIYVVPRIRVRIASELIFEEKDGNDVMMLGPKATSKGTCSDPFFLSPVFATSGEGVISTLGQKCLGFPGKPELERPCSPPFPLSFRSPPCPFRHSLRSSWSSCQPRSQRIGLQGKPCSPF